MVTLANLGGQPVLILPEGTIRNRGKDAQRNNIAAAKAIADAVRTTLGPKGMDKMLVDSIGDVVITNDGATILEEMQIEHPAAKMLVEVAKTQDDEAGDGTTTAVILAGELLKRAEELIEQEIHPTVITKGFRMAKAKTLEVLHKMGKPVSISDDEILKQIASTAMTGKSAEKASQELSGIAVAAVKKVAEGKTIDIDNIKIEKKEGGSISDTQLIEGVLVDKEVVHAAMPKKVSKAQIAVISSALEIKSLETDAKISIDSPEKMQLFLEEEEKMLKRMVDKIIESGANVVFCQKGIDDTAQHFLAKAKILTTRRVKKSDIDSLSRATGARAIHNLTDLKKEDLGYAETVEERKVAGDQMVFVEGCRQPKTVTILLRGGTEHVVSEVERAMEDAVKGLASALDIGKIVPGGGSTEMKVSKELRKYAEGFKGREQLAVIAFAEAVDIVPRSLAENAGLDPIDKIANIRAMLEKAGDNASYGLDVFTGNVEDMYKMGVVEPLKIKLQAVMSASEAAEMILRIDDVIASGGGGKSAPPMPPGGMGGMGGGMGDDY